MISIDDFHKLCLDPFRSLGNNGKKIEIIKNANARELLFIHSFIYLFAYLFFLSLWTIAVDLSGLQIYIFSACAKLFLWVLLSIIMILFTCPFFSGEAKMSTKFVVHNVFHLSESRKKSQFYPFSTTNNFPFKSLQTVFIIIHFIFLEPRATFSNAAAAEKLNPQTTKNAVKPLYTKETQLTCNAGEFGGWTKADCLS